MTEENGIKVYLKFEDEVCSIGSVLDGDNLYDVIHWHDDSPGYLVLSTIPRVGEIIYIDAFWLEVTGIMHKVFPGAEVFYGQTVSIRVKQIPLNDPRTNW
jgi:hypothetical protein